MLHADVALSVFCIELLGLVVGWCDMVMVSSCLTSPASSSLLFGVGLLGFSLICFQAGEGEIWHLGFKENSRVFQGRLKAKKILLGYEQTH